MDLSLLEIGLRLPFVGCFLKIIWLIYKEGLKLIFFFSLFDAEGSISVTLFLPLIFVLKMLSAFYICCRYSSALDTRFFVEANNEP